MSVVIMQAAINNARLRRQAARPDAVFEAKLDIVTPAGERPLIEVVSFVDRALIERLYRDPGELKVIERRRFEELVAELFAGFGYEVELTKRTRDGGKDIVAIKRREVDVRFLIECKRPDPGNPVAVGTVRELLGVKNDERATKAIVATTSYFTPDALQFEARNQWDLELRDYEGVREWLDYYMRAKGTA